ncbi:MAG TPA: chemotaxis protein CheB [Burkholderiales bacterium]|nr:chemotaxis protein CheB [Burkholderiales bacterium]
MARKDIVVVGASAGGMSALMRLVQGLPKDFPAALFVVWHLSPGVKSVLPHVLSRAGPLRAVNPADGDRIEPGRIYVAANDHHMLLEKGYLRVTRGPKENRFRPAIDPLFRSAAYIYGPRAIGVVLTGALDDGTAGLWAIKHRGGTAIVQDPEDAEHRSMPLNALHNVDVDYKLPAAEIGALLSRLVREEAPALPTGGQPELARMQAEIKIAEGGDAMEENVKQYGELSAFTCPECSGVLTLLRDGRLKRYRCHTGHAYSADALVESATEQVEHQLWSAVRALDETVMLLNQLGEDFAKNGDTRAAEFCFGKAREAYERSQPVREAAMRSEVLTADEAAGDEVPAKPVRAKQA